MPQTPTAVIAALVPGVRVTPVAVASGGASRLLRRAAAGMPRTAAFVVDDDSGLPSFTVRYPDHPDLLVEQVARVVDVARRMRLRFGAALAHARLVTIDHGQPGFRTARYAGMAHLTLGAIHLNGSLFLPEELAALERKRASRAGSPRARPPARSGTGYTQVDGTMAHELWHQIELEFMSREYRRSIEFRRRIGEYFGVATIEHAVENRGPAHDRLAQEVSAYGATRAIEATAEMAKLWWCGSRAPAAQHFAAVVDEFFPPP